MELFFDTETSGLPRKGMDYKDPNYPWIVQLAAVLSTEDRIVSQFSTIVLPINPEPIHPKAEEVHGISMQMCLDLGMSEYAVMNTFASMIGMASTTVCHNFDFDAGLVSAGFYRIDAPDFLEGKKFFCTMKSSTNLCKLPGRYGKYKWPKLEELHQFLFNEDFKGAHDAMVDVMVTRRCYYELKRRELI